MMLKIIIVIGIISSAIYGADIDLEFDKKSTKVMLTSKKSLAFELMKSENSQYNTIIQLTGSNLTRRKVCKREDDIIKCIKYSNGGKLVHIIDIFDTKDVSKVNGEYKKYYTAYIGNKNKYHCPIIVWNEDKFEFVSADNQKICKDELRIKYDGQYKNGQKVGTWTTTDKKGKETDKEFKYSKLRER